MADPQDLRLPARGFRQGSRSIPLVWTESALMDSASHRGFDCDDADLKGYQRPEVLNHILAIGAILI